LAYSTPFLPIVIALVIGAIGGTAFGRVVGDRKGASVGGLVGAVGSGLISYVLGTGALTPGEAMFSTLTLLAALGCGLMAGFFFAFSFLVMKALAQQPPAAGMATMQTINVVVFNPWFGGAFTITAIVCVLVMIVSLFRWEQSSAYVLIGGVLYVIGTLGVTAACNVPRNDALAAVAPSAAGAADVWSRYLDEWTMWNHVRTVAALAAAAALTMAVMRG
jgi:uncharacterized membrane protein